MSKRKLTQEELKEELKEEIKRGFESYFESICNMVYESTEDESIKNDIEGWVRKIIQDC